MNGDQKKASKSPSSSSSSVYTINLLYASPQWRHEGLAWQLLAQARQQLSPHIMTVVRDREHMEDLLSQAGFKPLTTPMEDLPEGMSVMISP